MNAAERKAQFNLAFLPLCLRSTQLILVAPHNPHFTGAVPRQVLNHVAAGLTVPYS